MAATRVKISSAGIEANGLSLSVATIASKKLRGSGDAEKPGFALTSVEESMLDFRASQDNVTCHAAQNLSLSATPLEFELALQEVERFWVTMDMQRHIQARPS
jgi:hypothetical protein